MEIVVADAVALHIMTCDCDSCRVYTVLFLPHMHLWQRLLYIGLLTSYYFLSWTCLTKINNYVKKLLCGPHFIVRPLLPNLVSKKYQESI